MTGELPHGFDMAARLVEQLISVAGVILAISITLLKDTRRKGPGSGLVGLSWVLYFVSILAGIWTLMALTGELAPVKAASEVVEELPNLGARIRIPSAIQILTFLGATVFLMVDGARRLRVPSGEE